MTDNSSPKESNSLNKAISVLSALADSSTALRFSELMSILKLPKATLHRQLSRLMEERLVRFDEEKQSYQIGFRILEFAHNTWANLDLRTMAEDQMKLIRDTTHETVHLAVLSHADVIYIDKFESPQSVRMFSAVGRKGPVFCTGVGKAMAAFQEPDTIEAILADVEFVQHTEHSIMTAEALNNEFEKIRQQGFALDDEEHEMGIHCIAAPILNEKGIAIAGLSITAPTFRVDKQKLMSFKQLVVDACQNITDRLGPMKSF